MDRLALVIIALLPVAAGASTAEPGAGAPLTVTSAAPSSEQLEKGLQGLNWGQFRSVVGAIPKLKADVDAYGPMGWQYVKENYRTYRWRKNIDKLSASQKTELGRLIADARRGSAR